MTLTIKAFGWDYPDDPWILHGEGQGNRGVWLSQDQVKGLFEAPIRQVWDATAQQIGGTLRGMWRDVRDISLGFHVTDRVAPIDVTLSAFRKAFTYQVDRWDHNAVLPRIEVISDLSGARSIDVQLCDTPDFNPGTDPLVTGYGNPILPLRAGQPNYYTPDVVTHFTAGTTSASGLITISNPTPLPMFHKFVVTRCQATLPDVSWQGPPNNRVPGVDKLSGRDDHNRNILLPLITSTHGGATVDLEHLNADRLMIRDASDQNMLGQMPVPGQYFSYEIPSWTQEQTLHVSYTNAPAGGAMIQCIQPRRWPEPFGGEW